MSDANEQSTPTWADREADLLNRIEGSINWNAAHAKGSQRLHNISQLSVIVLSVVTPVSVTLSHEAAGDPALFFYVVSLTAPLAIAIIEGIRRTLHFEDHWHESHVMMETLLDLRRRYHDPK